MRAFLQRSEVRLSTVHRVGQALLGGSALVLLLPLFIRDGFPKMTTLLVVVLRGGPVGRSSSASGSRRSCRSCCRSPPSTCWSATCSASTSRRTRSGRRARASDAPRRDGLQPPLHRPGPRASTTTSSRPTTRAAARRGTRRRVDPGAARPSEPRRRRVARPVRHPDVRDVGDGDPRGASPATTERLRQSFRLAGLNHDRTLAHDVARTEALLAKHVLASGWRCSATPRRCCCSSPRRSPSWPRRAWSSRRSSEDTAGGASPTASRPARRSSWRSSTCCGRRSRPAASPPRCG